MSLNASSCVESCLSNLSALPSIIVHSENILVFGHPFRGFCDKTVYTVVQFAARMTRWL